MQNIKMAMDHLKTHQTYPASKDELVKACEDLKEFSKEDKQWFKEHLPNKTYSSAEEVVSALGMQKQAMGMDQNSPIQI